MAKSLFDCDSPKLDSVGPYSINRYAGRGAMAFVFKASREGMSRPVALKLIPAEHFSKQRLRSLLCEAEITSGLHHPNVVSIFDYAKTDDMAYVAMPYISGASLHKLVSIGNPTKTQPASRLERYKWLTSMLQGNWPAIARVGAEIAGAIQAGHDAGVIHRDIKPANILIARDGKAWLTDYGVAWTPDESVQCGRLENSAGTPRFQAPEVFDGQRDHRCDLFSLGMSLYEVASGHQAWLGFGDTRLKAERPQLMLPRLRHVRPDVPLRLVQIIEKALAKKPDNRFQSAKELEHELNRFAFQGTAMDRRANARPAEAGTVVSTQSFVLNLTEDQQRNVEECLAE